MKLQHHLSQLGVNPHRWALKHDVPYFAVYRHLLGRRISYENAKAISAATDDAVTISEIMD